MKKETIFGKVFKYLEENKNIGTVDLIAHFPEYNKKTLKIYRLTFRKRNGIGSGERKLYKLEILSFLETLNDKQLAEITNTQMKEKISKPSLETLSLYLYEMRKKRNIKPVRVNWRRNSKHHKIFTFLDNNSDKRTSNDVYIEFPDFRPGTITAIVVQWYDERNITKPENVNTITAKWTDERLEKLRLDHYNTYVATMNRLNKEPKPPGHTPTYEAIYKVKDRLTKKEIKEMTPAKAWILVSCRPAVELLKKIFMENIDHINYDRTEKMIREIEKRLLIKNKPRSYSSIVGTAIYLANKNMSQTNISEIMGDFGGCTEVSIRSLCRIINFKKKF